MNAQVHPKNSTIVRTNKMALRAARAGFRVLSPRAPSLAAMWAERLFLTARRYERPFWEEEAIGVARARRLQYENGWIPTWTWTPSGQQARGFRLDDTPTILLVHGWEGRGSQLSTFALPLVEKGFRVIAFDAPGHGDSPLSRASVVETARAVVAIANAYGPIHGVVGHSVGAAAALFATRLGFEAQRFVLVSPPATPAQFASFFARTLGIDDAVKDAMIRRLEERYAIPFTEIDARIDAARLEAPMLVVHDRDDTVVPFERGEMLARTAPKGRLVETNGLGHRAILRAPHVVETVAAFVTSGARPKTFAETLDGELFMRDLRWT